ncbi:MULTISPECIES: hypothetical protein [unclassified Carboxylicivirga]|uniref:tetratricopeptide repeat protein n=1 Tax=Carboxylicivirga TaxID=1628153 RepID=UPI003D33101B
MSPKSIFAIISILYLSSFSLFAQSTLQLALTEGDYQSVIAQLKTRSASLTATERYYLALAYQQSGYPQKAIEQLLPDTISLGRQQHDLLCKCYLVTGNYPKALPLCEQRYAEEPQEVANLLRYAEINAFYKDYAHSIRILEPFVQHDSLNYSVNMMLAEAYERSNYIEKAIAMHKMILQQQPDNQKIALRLARLYYGHKDYVACHDLCVPYIERLDNNKNFLLIAGLANFKNGSNHNVLVMFRRLESQGDSSLITKKHLGIASYRLENYEAASRYLKAAFELKKDDPEVAFFLGASLGQSNTPLKGRPFLWLAKSLIQPSPSLMEKISVKLAMIHYDIGDYQYAIRSYHEAFKYDNKPQYIYHQASIYDHKLHDVQKAMENYQLFLDLLPDDLDSKKGSERYAIKLKQVVEQRLTALREDDFFKNGI